MASGVVYIDKASKVCLVLPLSATTFVGDSIDQSMWHIIISYLVSKVVSYELGSCVAAVVHKALQSGSDRFSCSVFLDKVKQASPRPSYRAL